ncbi:MAG TPA: DUF2318 domain-containing protein [Thermoplasmata archaeon]|nr:DUF2318 domain-containing protein [Thermoplasmata archaeon]HIH28751.1 DUF2318 domain-containing protein [Thermoplasmata archaeon]
MKKKLVVLGILLLSVMIYLGGCTSTTNNKNTNNNNNNPPQQNETEVRIPLSDISTTATFYSYDSNGVTVRYFAVKDAQGAVHVAFDACDVCYEAKKGYKQVGVEMQCLNCGKQFAITSIGSENTAGGCWPSYLDMKMDGNDVVIKIADLQAKSFMF